MTTDNGKNATTHVVDSGFREHFLNVTVDNPTPPPPPAEEEVVTPPAEEQPPPPPQPAPDADTDGVPDASDNCVNTANPGQANVDADALGDACDSNSFAPEVGTPQSTLTARRGRLWLPPARSPTLTRTLPSRSP